MVSKEEALANAIKYFNETSEQHMISDVWLSKYAMKDRDGSILESSPEDTFKRLASKFDESSSVYKSILSRDFIPGGRIIASYGSGSRRMTNLNCYVLGIDEDSIDGIFRTARNMARIYSAGGGCGVSLNILRPRGAPTNNAALMSSGAYSFSSLLSSVTSSMCQSGRRGALILLLSIEHPDAEYFARMKNDVPSEWKRIASQDKDLTEWIEEHRYARYANVTLQLTDLFMAAVASNSPTFVQEFKNKDVSLIRKEVDPVKLFDTIADGAASSAEPGVCFWDTISRESPSNYYSEEHHISGLNPCMPAWATVFTPDGISTIGQLCVGHTIWSGKGWTKVINKVSSGIQQVFAYRTIGGTFYGTPEHRVVSKGEKVQVKDAEYIDTASIDNTEVSVPLRIHNKEYISTEEVFDITVDAEEHTYWTDGLLVSNCGEQPLQNNGACCLGSINLGKMAINSFSDAATVDWLKLESVVRSAVNYLDHIIDVEVEEHRSPLPEIERILLDTRRVGIGVMGLSELLIRLGITYGSDACIETCDKIFRHMMNWAYDESTRISEVKDPFRIYDWNNHKQVPIIGRLDPHICNKIKKYGLRNITLLSIAPTGSIAIIGATSGGIEPYLDFVYKRRQYRGGDAPIEYIYHETIVEDYYIYQESIGNKNCREHILPAYFIKAHDVPWLQRVKLQATIQKYIDSSISSTVNLPESATKEDVKNIYMTAYRMGLKGITVYREGSRNAIISSIKKEEKKITVEEPSEFNYTESKEVATLLDCKRLTFKTTNHRALLHVGFDAITKMPIEVCLRYGRTDAELDSLSQALGILMSIMLQEGIHPERIARTMRSIKAGWTARVKLHPDDEKTTLITSVPDALSLMLMRYTPTKGSDIKSVVDIEGSSICSKCLCRAVVHAEGCMTCLACGDSKCS
jgi:ribonucleotide reductase alpha subunit